MKKTFTTIVALAFAVTGFTAFASVSPDASPEAKPAKAAVEAPAPVASPEISIADGVVVPVMIVEHLTTRFPGSSVEGISREGLTYVVDLGNGHHIRYDNAYNPICYGDHSHDADYRHYKKP